MRACLWPNPYALAARTCACTIGVDITGALVPACWAVFFLSMVAGARLTRRIAERQRIVSRLAYGIPLVISFILLLNGIDTLPGSGNEARGSIHPLAIPVLPDSPWIAGTGSVCVVTGLILALWARTSLGSNWSGSVSLKENHALVQTGPYACVRHPIYFGLLLMYLGTALAFGYLGGFVGFPVLFLSCWIKLRQEEAMMIRHFGDRYRGYQSRVKALIPFLV